jgi:hypothetical protein
LKLLLGHVWAATTSALGGDHEFADTGTESAPGVRGSSFTASIGPGGQMRFHVIEGTGFIQVPGKPEFDFPAGEGVLVSGSHFTVTTNWPAADQALVPAGQRPPKLSGVRLTGARAGKRAKLRFTLNESAAVNVTLQRGRRRLQSRKASARRGAGSITLGALPRGAYTLTVIATVHKPSSAVQTSFRVS